MYPMRQAKALIDCFSEWDAGKGIFDYLHQFEWNPDSTSAFSFNSDYFCNHSGGKAASPLVMRYASDSDYLTLVEIQTLAHIIYNRFHNKWDSLYSTYISSDSLFDTINVVSTTAGTVNSTDTKSRITSESKTSKASDSESEVKSGTRRDSESRADSGVTTLSGGHTERHSTSDSSTSITANDTDTTDSTVTADTTRHEGSVTDTSATQGDASVFGFNSTTAVPTTRNLTTDGTTSVRDTTDNNANTTARSTSVSGSVNDTTTGAGTRDIAIQYNDESNMRSASSDSSSTSDSSNTRTTASDSSTLSDTSTQESLSGANTSATDETNTRKGYDYSRGITRVDILEKLYTVPELFNFFEVVYADIDEVLTSPYYV